MRSPTRTDPRRWVKAIRITGFLIGTMLLGTLVTLFKSNTTGKTGGLFM